MNADDFRKYCGKHAVSLQKDKRETDSSPGLCRILGLKDNANCRNVSDAATHSENTIIGASAAIATASPMRFESFLNKCRAEADKAKMNQLTMSPVTNLA